MNQFATLLVIVLLPGIIATVVFGKLTRHERWNSFTFSVHAVIFGWFSYLPLYLVPAQWFDSQVIDLPLKKLNEIDQSIYWDVMLACLLSLPLALLLAYSANYHLLNRLARFIRCSHKYGEESLFSYYLSNENVDWVYVRCSKEGRVYKGKLINYGNDNGKDMHEILLENADIYTYDDSVLLRHADEIYLCAPAGDFVIELAANKGGTDKKQRIGRKQSFFGMLPPRQSADIAPPPAALISPALKTEPNASSVKPGRLIKDK